MTNKKSHSDSTPPQSYKVLDANEAAAEIAYKTNEICIIYPITPASQMGEFTDEWRAQQKANIWQQIPDVIEMQSEGGVAGAMHGALQTGSLATTFTSSQGLLLMIPDMYRIAGELTPAVFHVAARAVAPQGMSIYCEHSDVMATRATGFAIVSSTSAQEAYDMALITQAATLKSRVPFLHFFDGFRTSHEISKVKIIPDELIKEFIEEQYILAHRARRLSPENPFVRGVIYDSDIFFQQREAVEKYYQQTPEIFNQYCEKLFRLTGRKYSAFEYYGAQDADRIIILMGAAVNTVKETVAHLIKQGEKVGLINVRLFQPFSTQLFINLLPTTCKKIAVLDHTKEPGAGGEPLYQKIATTLLAAYNQGKLATKNLPQVINGRYGIGGKEFNPAMVMAIFAELNKTTPKSNFTIGINDDICHTNLNYADNLDIESDHVLRAIFYGLGADGTVSANKSSMKIIGEETENQVQGYFIYDSKKSGSKTISHLRVSPTTINSAYQIKSANFIGCHQFAFIETFDILAQAATSATLLLNTRYNASEIWNKLPIQAQKHIIEKNITLYIIDAYQLAKKIGLKNRINTIMQTCFFYLTNIIPLEIYLNKIKQHITRAYQKKGKETLEKNFAAVDIAIDNLVKVSLPTAITGTFNIKSQIVTTANSQPVITMVDKMLAAQGNEIPVSAIPADGTYPTGIAKLHERNLSEQVPCWNGELCIQCGRCTLACPHSVIRAKHLTAEHLSHAPNSLKFAQARNNKNNLKYALHINSNHCTGCGACEQACPLGDKAIKLAPKTTDKTQQATENEFFANLITDENQHINEATINNLQFTNPLFEFSGACAGCGETPYIKLLTQLFGDRLIIANACGCSSVYGSNMPTSPWSVNKNNNGPCWSSSLFEDNAEFGFGFRLTEDYQRQQAIYLLTNNKLNLDRNLITEIINAPQTSANDIAKQRERIKQLKQQLETINNNEAAEINSLIDYLIRHSIWSVGGDGWAYDIGFAGLDHVLASGRDINLLVLDTEVYSNTGGQASKASPRGGVVKFAANGKNKAKKDLGLMAITYGEAYVASIAIGANPEQAIKAFIEAESYAGPSLIIAYCHCIAHGIDMSQGNLQQQLAVKCGYWPLYRYNPLLKQSGKNPLQIDSPEPTITFKEYAKNENRYQILVRNNPKEAERLFALAEKDIENKWKIYHKLAKD